MPPSAQTTRTVFLTRDPVVHERSGSTSYIFGLLDLLRAQGADLTLVCTSARSRSPRLFFRMVVPPPAGVHLRFPGYLRLGSLYLLPASPKAWARAIVRFAARKPALTSLRRVCGGLFGPGLYTGAWDLTPPTPAEGELAIAEAERAHASVVVANYCFWGPLLHDRHFNDRRTAILMHDLLSARARRFAESGTPLDMPPLSEDQEIAWLSGADTVLAAQAREAEQIRSRVGGNVIVTPVLLHPQALDPDKVIPGRCLFVGSNIAPNRSGLEFLVEAVWPRVRAAVPGATLAIAGTVGQTLGAQAQAHTLRSQGIVILGTVPTLQTEYARAALCLVPLRLGTGIKIKLLEALGFGKAIVSTTLGIEGLESWAHEGISVADDPEAFAAAIILLLIDDRLRREREQVVLRLAALHFGSQRELDPAFRDAIF